jgi:alpha-D-glucose phosphate-specific phosphoglucomutase
MIKFGTDGWRAKIAEEYTFDNVRLVTQAIVNYVKKTGEKKGPILVGYDNRFLSDQYAREAAKVIQSSGFECLLSGRELPTPLLSFAVKTLNAPGGIMITASHNPPEYNGMKFKAGYAGSALPEITNEIEAELSRLISSGGQVSAGRKLKKEYFDPEFGYLNHLKELVDLKRISSSKLQVIIDPMYGSAIGYLSGMLKNMGVKVTEINNKRDPLFGGTSPEPLPPNLEELFSVVREASLKNPDEITIGIALDGDGDRISAVDGSGTFINPHNIFAIVLKHLVENKKQKGDIVKTFNITNLINLMAKEYGLKLHTTPIGFKHICRLMLEQDILIGGEESGGLSVKGHIPERDATFIALLLLEAAAFENKSLKTILNDLMEKHGHFYYDRIDLHVSDEQKRAILEKFKRALPKTFAKSKIAGVESLDGVKLNLEDGSWILFRASGTEPLLRIYAEAKSDEKLKMMLAEGEDIARSR